MTSEQVFWVYLNQVTSRSEFFQLLTDTCYNYSVILSSDSQFSLEASLTLIRDTVWQFICEHCASFLNRSSDAQFSEIFSSSIFGEINEEKAGIFKTNYVLKSLCQRCSTDVVTNFEVLVNFINIASGGLFHQWHDLLNPTFANKSLECQRCGQNTTYPVLIDSYRPAKILFIEFSREFIGNRCIITEDMLLENYSYRLKALVCNVGAHFTCAIFDNQGGLDFYR